MNIRFTKYMMIAFILLFGMKSNAQTGPATAPVVYEVIYNTSTCLYEAHAHVQSGALAFPMTIPFPSNFTIVIPESFADTPISATSYQPPSLSWTNSNNVYSPAADPIHDFHMFSISGGGAGQAYTTFQAGDDILLFTFSIPHSACEEGIRVFINGTDPDSSAPGMNGLDLSNSLKTINPSFPQGSEQYTANINNDGIVLPKPTSNPSFDCSGSTIELFANPSTIPACLSPLSFEWNGPNGFTSTEEDPTIAVTDPVAQSGTYSLVVTDSNGCTFQGNQDIDNTSCALLPVELLSFDAKKDNKEVILEWVTANEINNDYFDVQRSTDGKNFKSIGKVAGNGNINTETSYSFIDHTPERDNYYRLNQVDYDGRNEFSETRYITFEQDQLKENNVYPNPFNNTLNIDISEGTYKVKIYDIYGKSVFNTNFESGNSLYLPEMTSGTYLLKVENANGINVIEQIIIKI